MGANETLELKSNSWLGQRMNWSLSEFLNLIELRGQSWCFVNFSSGNGMGVAHGDALFFHAVLEGEVRLARGDGRILELQAGDVAMVPTGDAHAVRDREEGQLQTVELLNTGEQLDVPSTVNLGNGATTARLLSGRIKMRWPGGSPPVRMPRLMLLPARETGVNLERFTDTGSYPGEAALLTHLATLLFISAFIRNARCQALFRFNLDNPLARANVLLQKHPFQPWTVDSLAQKVGMGRSNFAARFTAEFGKTPIDALTEERMKQAEHFLNFTDLKIAEVSERVGYRSEAAFIRRFTAHFGMTPGKLRRLSAKG